MAARVTQAQLERAVGGAAQLLELVDLNRTGYLTDTSCQDFITQVLNDGNAEVNGYISLAVDLADTSLQTAPLLIRYELDIDVYLCWLRGAQGSAAIPDKVERARELAIIELEKIGARQKGVGLAARPTTSQPVQQVTKDATEAWFSSVSPRRRFDGFS